MYLDVVRFMGVSPCVYMARPHTVGDYRNVVAYVLRTMLLCYT